MSRQEATNTFQEGLISDLNPINTPDSVLTDALNATLITYNGNEFILQNDQGNYPLQYCKLRSGFVPVGTTQYADTMYIASYNPMTKETEIGTYPSPRTIFSTKDKDQEVTFVPLVDGVIGLNNNYTDLIKNAKLQIYALADDMENYKLNPGDRFVILLGDEDSFPYQTIQFAILTDNKELISIDIPLNEGYILPLNSSVGDEDYKYVFWEVPGWLTGKYRLAVMDQFYLNVRSVTLPEFTTTGRFNVTDIQINTQMEVTDELFRNNPNPNANTLRDLKVEYRWCVNGSSWSSPIIGTLGEHHYNDSMDIYYDNWTFDVNNVSINDVIIVEAVPYVEYNGSRVYYDQFRTSIEINLASINDARDINAANITYKYIGDADSVTLTFNVEGPFINNSLIDMYLEVYKIYDGTPVLVYNNNGNPESDVNLLGTNTFDLPLGNGIEMEDMYILSIVFKEGTTYLKRINKLMILSVTMNEFYNSYNYYDDIYLDQWITKYPEVVKESGLNIRADFNEVGTASEWTYDPNKSKVWTRDIQIIPSTSTTDIGIVDKPYWYGNADGSGRYWTSHTDINPATGLYLPKSDYYRVPYNWFTLNRSTLAAPTYIYGTNIETVVHGSTDLGTIAGNLWKSSADPDNYNASLSYNIITDIETKAGIIENFDLLNGSSSKPISEMIGGSVIGGYTELDHQVRGISVYRTSQLRLYQYSPNTSTDPTKDNEVMRINGATVRLFGADRSNNRCQIQKVIFDLKSGKATTYSGLLLDANDPRRGGSTWTRDENAITGDIVKILMQCFEQPGPGMGVSPPELCILVVKGESGSGSDEGDIKALLAPWLDPPVENKTFIYLMMKFGGPALDSSESVVIFPVYGPAMTNPYGQLPTNIAVSVNTDTTVEVNDYLRWYNTIKMLLDTIYYVGVNLTTYQGWWVAPTATISKNDEITVKDFVLRTSLNNLDYFSDIPVSFFTNYSQIENRVKQLANSDPITVGMIGTEIITNNLRTSNSQPISPFTSTITSDAAPYKRVPISEDTLTALEKFAHYINTTVAEMAIEEHNASQIDEVNEGTAAANLFLNQKVIDQYYAEYDQALHSFEPLLLMQNSGGAYYRAKVVVNRSSQSVRGFFKGFVPINNELYAVVGRASETTSENNGVYIPFVRE